MCVCGVMRRARHSTPPSLSSSTCWTRVTARCYMMEMLSSNMQITMTTGNLEVFFKYK